MNLNSLKKRKRPKTTVIRQRDLIPFAEERTRLTQNTQGLPVLITQQLPLGPAPIVTGAPPAAFADNDNFAHLDNNPMVDNVDDTMPISIRHVKVI